MDKQSYHSCLLPGFDVLIDNPEIINPLVKTKKKADALYLPNGFFDRACGFCEDPRERYSIRGYACHFIVRYFRILYSMRHTSGKDFVPLPNGTKVYFRDPKNLFNEERFFESTKLQVVALAIELTAGNPNSADFAILTANDRLAGYASRKNLDVVEYTPKVYTGRRKVFLPFEASSLWFSNKRISPEEWRDAFPKEDALLPNEFVEFSSDVPILTGKKFDLIGRFDAEENALVPLRHTCLSTRENPARIFPRNAGQAMMIEALQTPPSKVPLVIASGIFGTGKTFLSVAAGYFAMLSGLYRKIFICPRDGALGREIGFIPGDTTEKTRAKAKAIDDALLEVLSIMRGPNSDSKKSAYETWNSLEKEAENILTKYFKFEPLINMGGHSLKQMFFFLDEAQDLNAGQLRELLSRTGDETKTVLAGDPTQVSNFTVNKSNSGISVAASQFAGNPKAMVVTFENSEIARSDASRLVAETMPF
ncbi:PhoH family protein [Candidatus Saccharibacteria bacterium]|nr:PhoH family protein [Candidatus Saccharibacteria bacterium]MBQ6147607.1 PhoH family protein [Candidatus Saccharibacteria bacterium]